MFVSLEQAIARYTAIIESGVTQFAKTAGDHVAEGVIVPAHGVCTPTNHHGHFDLYEYHGVSLRPVFTVVKKI